MRSPVPAFRFTGVIPLLWPRFLIPRLTLSSGKAVRSKLDCMHEPPVQSDCCAFSVTINLSPTRKDTTYHHWQQPLVTHSQNKEVLKCEVNYSYTVRTNSVSVLCESQLPRFRNLPVNEPSKKPPCRVVFFVYRAKDYADEQPGVNNTHSLLWLLIWLLIVIFKTKMLYSDTTR